jgi:NitT/TauT family transport system permease protein
MRLSTQGFKTGPIAGAAIIVIIWWAGSAIIKSPLLLPSPSETIRALVRIAGEPSFPSNIAATALRVAYAFILSLVLGAAVGAASGLSGTLKSVLSPVMATLRTVPFISLSVLSLVWFRSGAVPVFVAFLMAFPIVAGIVSEAVASVDDKLIELSTVYKVPKPRMLRSLYAPSLAPYLVSAAAQAMGVSWKIVVSAEVLSIPRAGIGAGMDTARAFLDTPGLFAWTLLLIVIGYLTDLLLNRLMRASFRRKEAGA